MPWCQIPFVVHSQAVAGCWLQGVRWAEDVVDNEFMNKKSSKKCCIFHKQRPFGEWSDDDSDTECNQCD